MIKTVKVKTPKLCLCGKEAFVRVPYGRLCLSCYRSGVKIPNPTPANPKAGKKKHGKYKKNPPHWLVNGHVVYELYIRSKAWFRKRELKLKEVGYKCEVITCKSPLDLVAHHLTYDRLGHEQLSDLKILCQVCHMDAHERLPFPKKYYKFDYDSEDFSESSVLKDYAGVRR